MTAEEKQEIEKLAAADRTVRLRCFLEKEVWPSIPPSLRGTTISKAEREEILGYGPEGV